MACSRSLSEYPSFSLLDSAMTYLRKLLLLGATGPAMRHNVLLAVQHGTSMPALGGHSLVPEYGNTAPFLSDVSHWFCLHVRILQQRSDRLSAPKF